MSYSILKTIHLTCVAATIVSFSLRGWWKLTESPRLRSRWARVVPHMIDASLLASAVGLTMKIHQYPFVQTWLTVKILAVCAYIALGFVALRFGRSRRQRLAAWVGAQLVFAYIVAVALTRNPNPFLPGA